jgi:glycosyltransferase involved in cell wall biosynthesis
VIGIALLTLVPGVVGGSETYARELVRGLARAGRLRYHVFAPTIAPGAIDGLSGSTVSAYPARRSTAGRVRAMATATVFPGRIQRELKKAPLRALHFPLTLPIPRGTRLPVAVSILDIQHELHPRFFPRAELAYRKLAYRAAVGAACLVITISEHAKETIVERLDIPPQRVHAIYLGVDHEQLHPGTGQREPFLLYPANRWPHKNHARLLEAFALLRRTRPELRLVLTGSGHERSPSAPGVEARGHVSREELVRLYQTAAALVFPSLYEGFGLPPLEAMACGCPVAASRAGALPEVLGDAAVTFDANDPEAIAAGVAAVLDDPEPFAHRGLARARGFTWDECARRHDDVYAELSSA